MLFRLAKLFVSGGQKALTFGHGDHSDLHVVTHELARGLQGPGRVGGGQGRAGKAAQDVVVGAGGVLGVGLARHGVSPFVLSIITHRYFPIASYI